jgi:peptidoglycan/LPS O-acetylase OafA/YrhL
MVTRMTWSGVDLFFVLSGYLIGSILLQNRESVSYYQPFFIRRLCRILPLYFTLLIGALIATSPPVLERIPELAPVFNWRLPPWTFFLQVQNIAMAIEGRFAQQALTVTWSLALEEQFYLLLPFLIRWIPYRVLPWMCLGFILSALVLRICLFHFAPAKAAFWSYVSLPCRWDALFCGVAIAWLWSNQKSRTYLWLRRIAVTSIWLCLGAVLLWLSITARGVIMSPFITQWGYTILALFYGLSLHLVLCYRGRAWLGWLAWKPLVTIGMTSYGIYLLHEPLHAVWALYGHGLSRGMILCLTSIVLALLVALSWRYLESPAIRYGQKHKYQV